MKTDVKDVCVELERVSQLNKSKTVGGWLRQRKQKLQDEKKSVKEEKRD